MIQREYARRVGLHLSFSREVGRDKMEIVTNQIDGDRGSEHSFALRMLTAFSLVSALMLAMGSRIRLQRRQEADLFGPPRSRVWANWGIGG